MRRIAPDWIDAPATRTVIAALALGRPRFVGGCVRDALMGRETGDIDIAVVTPPQETLRLASAAGLGAHPTGIDHGVVTVTVEGRAFEVATLRRDVATDGRRAVVAFTDDLAEDAARRDFTMNALYATPEGEVIDPLGAGLADLDARRIRFVGEPGERIREDYLRILRFFRFHAQFGIAEWDPAGLSACHALVEGLRRVSKERIGAEMLKLLAAPDPEPTLAAMGPVLGQALPGAAPFAGLTAAEAALDLPPDPLRRLAALSAATPETALRLSGAEAKRLSAITAARALLLHEAAWRHGGDAARSALALAAMEGAPPPADWRKTIEVATEASFPVAAVDLLDRGWVTGPALGAELKRLEAVWLSSRFALDRAALLELIASPKDART